MGVRTSLGATVARRAKRNPGCSPGLVGSPAIWQLRTDNFCKESLVANVTRRQGKSQLPEPKSPAGPDAGGGLSIGVDLRVKGSGVITQAQVQKLLAGLTAGLATLIGLIIVRLLQW
jgi:hypothetical protein